MPNAYPPIQGLIIDMDGVLWLDTQPIGDLPWIFSEFKQRGWQVTLATNNATRTPQQHLAKLAGFGVALEDHQVINSSVAVAHFLQERYPPGSHLFVVGEEALTLILEKAGFIISEDKPVAVIGSMDRFVNYKKLARATLLIRSGVPFLGTNPDRTFPTPEGLVPGAGAILAAIEAATSVAPTIIGKPSPEMYRVALERMHIQPGAALVVGDRLETDIAGAQQLGCQTALVLSGVTSPEMATGWSPRPDWIAKDLAQLLELIDSASRLN